MTVFSTQVIKKCSFFIIIFSTLSALCMKQQEGEKIDFSLYDQFRVAAFKMLTSEEQQAVGPDRYQENRGEGIKALHVLARNVVTLAYGAKIGEKELAKKSNDFGCHLVNLRDISLGLAKPEKVVDEESAKVYAVSLLTPEERKSLQKQKYCTNREKAYATLSHFAQLTADALIKENLLHEPKEDFQERFVESKIQELNKLYF